MANKKKTKGKDSKKSGKVKKGSNGKKGKKDKKGAKAKKSKKKGKSPKLSGTLEKVPVRADSAATLPEVEPAPIDTGERPPTAAPRAYDLPVDAEPVKEHLHPERPISELLRVDAGFVLADFDPSSTPGFDGDKETAEQALVAFADEIGEWQERLWAESKAGGQRSLLVVLQGLDSAGKGGIVRHVMRHADPAGIKATSFKAPTPEEKRHSFLWRIRKALPAPGQIGVFDRSHYEDVLVVRVLDLAPQMVIEQRYPTINDFERGLVDGGTQIVKLFLCISKDEQRDRLMERLRRPDKHYKFNPGDTDNRAHWDAYQEAFQIMLDRTSTDVAPWHIIPANHKWYARYAAQQLILEKLRQMSPDWPLPDYDVDAEMARLASS
ncbi:MAG: polyphosphate kinase (could be polyphosphate AMP phosphotransferase (pap)) [Actinomycetales bacterium]|nr:MAG: polyphosphate kinase (could be polyphosphate AMP phosphotransferase (pap)) [Actinomycetales bacterium]